MKQKIPYNFAGLDARYCQYEQSKIVILPVAFDKTSSWQRGSRRGPKAIIAASRFMELYDMETRSEIYKKGIFTDKIVKPRNPGQLNRVVKHKVSAHLSKNKLIVTLGGEHSISLGSITAYKELYPNLSVLHLDAHADLRDTYEDNKYNHACIMARVGEKIDKIVSVGIRSMDITEEKAARRIICIDMETISQKSNWEKQVWQGLSNDVYVTIDVDVFDTGLMPSTGTPEPGGMSWSQVINLLSELCQRKNVVGFDLVELCPSANKTPDYLAAKLIYKFLSYIFLDKNKIASSGSCQ